MRRDYSDIIDRERPVSKKHPPMDRMMRAAQFAPFAALTGHDEAVRETARLTEEEIELDEYEVAEPAVVSGAQGYGSSGRTFCEGCEKRGRCLREGHRNSEENR